jgi:hypothetical protein
VACMKTKKNFKGFPMFFTLENFENSLKRWSKAEDEPSLCHCRRRCRRHRRGRSTVKRQMLMIGKRWSRCGGESGNLPFVRLLSMWFIIVRRRLWSEANVSGRIGKRDEEAKKKRIKRNGGK